MDFDLKNNCKKYRQKTGQKNGQSLVKGQLHAARYTRSNKKTIQWMLRQYMKHFVKCIQLGGANVETQEIKYCKYSYKKNKVQLFEEAEF